MMKNKVLSICRRSIPYIRELNSITGSVRATLLMTQLEYWFAKYPDGFYKFSEPCDHELYQHDQSWIEELGFSVDGIRNAFERIGVRWKSETQFKEAKDSGREFIGDDGKEKHYCSVFFRRKGITMYFRNHTKVDRDLDDLTRGTFSPPPSPPQPTSPPPMPPIQPSTSTPVSSSFYTSDNVQFVETAKRDLQKTEEKGRCRNSEKMVVETAKRDLPYLYSSTESTEESTTESTFEIFNLSIKNFTQSGSENLFLANGVKVETPSFESRVDVVSLDPSTFSSDSTCNQKGGGVRSGVERDADGVCVVDTVRQSHGESVVMSAFQETPCKSLIGDEQVRNDQTYLFEQERALNDLKSPSNEVCNTSSELALAHSTDSSLPLNDGVSDCELEDKGGGVSSKKRRSVKASEKRGRESAEERAEREQFFGFLHKVNQWLISHGALSARLDAYWRWYQSLKKRDKTLTLETFSTIVRYYFLDNTTVWAKSIRNLPKFRAQFDSIYQTYQVNHNKNLTAISNEQTQLDQRSQTLIATHATQPLWKTSYGERVHALSKYGHLYNDYCEQHGYISFDAFMERFTATQSAPTPVDTSFQVMHTS